MKFLALLLLAGTVSAYHQYVNMPSDEIDSEEHGVLPGRRSTSCKCGWANRFTSRIVGGQETGVNQFPWTIGITNRRSYFVFCGGSIISEYHVLTAAHCTVDDTASTLAVVVGEHNTALKHETDATELINVKTITEHELYNPRDTTNDISLLTLERKIIFSSKVGPACLPTGRNSFNLVNKYIKVIGWGLTQTNGSPSKWLRHTNLRVIPLDICKRSFRAYIDTISPKQICTYSKRRDACQGDSGGPVVYLDPDTNRYTLVGVVSYGAECATDTPGVNTDVAAYIDWVQRNMRITNPAGKQCTKI